MQVTQINDHCTHAVIGGKQTIEFGISSSAEFYNILSSTLYKDQILAVVRETLCNAWDAHIEAGCTDKPVQIKLTSDTLTIKDFGTGIHHDDMGMIYATYGNSTKKNDGNQTGGFGLGCKAPFAYTDHFEVISCHAGVKTIYTLSKSSTQAQGKPGITPIATFPSEETGLQVTIRIKNSSDYLRFSNLIQRIARNGDMNIEVNGVPVKPLGFVATTEDFFVTADNAILDQHTPIMVRYGNVIYPVDPSPTLADKYNRICEHLRVLGNHYNHRIIFQAPPHSISVTPSRESLSMQEHTLATLEKLFDGFIKVLDTKFMRLCEEFAENVIQKAVSAGQVGMLLSREKRLPVRKGSLVTSASKLTTMQGMADYYMTTLYPKQHSFHKFDIKCRLERLAKEGLLDKGAVQTYLHDLKKSEVLFKERRFFQEKNDWLQRRVIAPLVSKLAQSGLDYERLYTCDPLETSSGYCNRASEQSLNKAITSSLPHHIAALPYLRNIVVLASAKSNVAYRAHKHPVFEKLGKEYGFLFYHVGLKAAEKSAAIAFFKSTGMQVVDLTFKQKWESDNTSITPVVKKPKQAGVVALSALKDSGGFLNTYLVKSTSADKTTTPEFVLKVDLRTSASRYFPGLSRNASQTVITLFGDKGGVVTSTAAENAWIRRGAIPFKQYIVEKVCDYMQNNPRIKQDWASNAEHVIACTDSRDIMIRLVNLLYSNQQLRDTFSLQNALTIEDKNYITIWKYITSSAHHFDKPDKIKDTEKYLASIKTNAACRKLIKKLEKNVLIDCLRVSSIDSLINNSEIDPFNATKAMKLLLKTINS